MKNVKLTNLEKATLRQAFDYGYAYNHWEAPLIYWGFVGKRERRALANLVEKGIVYTFKDKDGYTYVCVGYGYTKDDLANMCGAKSSLKSL